MKKNKTLISKLKNLQVTKRSVFVENAKTFHTKQYKTTKREKKKA